MSDFRILRNLYIFSLLPTIFLAKDIHLSCVMQDGSLPAIADGDEESYLCKDSLGTSLWIIKPASSMHPSTVHKEALSYACACLYKIEHVLPTVYLDTLDIPEPRLCSVQEYIPGAKPLRFFIRHLLNLGLPEDTLSSYLDAEDFACISLLTWLTYDIDAHASNILVYPKNGLYGMKSIDHSFAFPPTHVGFHPFVMHLPLAHTLLSSSIKEKILLIPKDAAASLFSLYGLTSSLAAFEERLEVLQILAKRSDITYYDVFLQLCLLGQ